MRIASFHLATFPGRRMVSRLLNIPAERWELSEAEGCHFGRILGTSRVGTTRTSVAISRWAMFAIWENDEALESFLHQSSLSRRWSGAASQMSEYRLVPLMARGSWDGVELFDELPAPQSSNDSAGPVAALTRATIPLAKWRAFAKKTADVDDALWKAPGCDLALGMGEWPVGKLATFSIWESSRALSAFAYDSGAHSTAIAARYAKKWFSEEFFGRFTVSELRRAGKT